MTKCLHCGHCCIVDSVDIIKPEAINEYGNVNVKDQNNYIYKATYKECPHLTWKNDGKAHCNIHHLSWYKETPCYRHNKNIIKDPCNTGIFNISKKIDIRDKCKKMRDALLNDPFFREYFL
jgi:hypothetical protein